jgi:simple sugar transport system ATP-binding protein
VVSERFGLALDPDAVVGELPIGLQQRVEIVTVLMRGAQVLIFDEPTAVLTDEESESFFEVLRRLRAGGRAIVFITHKLREALALADTVSVLRRGRVVATLDPATTTVAELGTLMVGRSVENVARSGVADSEAAEALLSLRGVSLRRGGIDEVGLHDVSLEVRAGEILALLGVDGNGQQEIVSVLTGTHAPDEGTVHIGPTDLTGRRTADFLAAGVGIIPADRQREGLVLSMSLARNLVLDRRNERQFRGRFGLLDDRKIEAHAREMIARYDIRVPGPRLPVRQLSGGNQQKVILARELERDIRVLVAAHPTRGLDVGSIEYVHGRLVDLAERGRAVVLITSDIDEAMALADRVAVLYRGRVAGVVARPLSRDELGVLMGGG